MSANDFPELGRGVHRILKNVHFPNGTRLAKGQVELTRGSIFGRKNMRARSYAFVWLLFIVAAGILWLADVFTFLAATILGAVAGLILMGRIFMSLTTRYSVPLERLRSPLAEQNIDPAARPYEYENKRTHYPITLRYH